MSKLYLGANTTKDEYVEQAALAYELVKAKARYDKALQEAAKILRQIGQARHRASDIYSISPWLDELIKDASRGLVWSGAFAFDIEDKFEAYLGIGSAEFAKFFADKQQVIDLEPHYSKLLVEIAEAIASTYAKFNKEIGLPIAD